MSAYISEVCTVPGCKSVPMSEGECWMCPKHARELEARIADLERLIRSREEPAGAALPPCPFCGEAERLSVRALASEACAPDVYAVECPSCLASGPVEDDATEARRAWAECYRRAGEVAAMSYITLMLSLISMLAFAGCREDPEQCTGEPTRWCVDEESTSGDVLLWVSYDGGPAAQSTEHDTTLAEAVDQYDATACWEYDPSIDEHCIHRSDPVGGACTSIDDCADGELCLTGLCQVIDP